MFSKINKKLLSVLSISLLVHVVALIILGTVIVINIVTRDEEIFEAPPAVQAITPPKKQYQVSLEKLKNKTSSAKLSPIVTKQISKLNIPSIDVKVSPSTNTTFSTDDVGLNKGFSSLGDAGNINFKELAEIKLFGIESTGEKFFILIDASNNMLIDSRGGIPGYKYVKEKVLEVVNGLPSGVLFNVAFYNNTKVDMFSQKMLRASDDNKSRLQAWMAPVNSDSLSKDLNNNAIINSEIEPVAKNLAYTPKALNAAFGQNPDNIFLLTSGWAYMGRLYSIHKDRERWGEYLIKKEGFSNKEVEEYYEKGLPLWDQHSKDRQDHVNAKLNKINAERAKKGLPPKVLNLNEFNKLAADFPSFKKYSNGMDFPIPPGIDKDIVQDYINNMVEEFYESKNLKPPVLNTIGFFTDKPNDKLKEKEKEDASWLRSIARRLDGKFEDVRLAKQIRNL